MLDLRPSLSSSLSFVEHQRRYGCGILSFLECTFSIYRANLEIDKSTSQILKSSVPGKTGFFLPRPSLGDRTSSDWWNGAQHSNGSTVGRVRWGYGYSHHRRTSSADLFDIHDIQEDSLRLPRPPRKENEDEEEERENERERLASGQRFRSLDAMLWCRLYLL
ncbi:hypothetical protein GYMLUDRAFT_236714 [Collybiopsis luxurians FD-317 M1]|nr:hypothetical protein GYMLUDRAFT_236714 [Collybiopsis luxurians FD-317 M1]